MSLSNELDEWKERAEDAEADIGRLRAAIRVNALRWGYTDSEIDKVLAGDATQ
jgi:hypothetical protein